MTKTDDGDGTAARRGDAQTAPAYPANITIGMCGTYIGAHGGRSGADWHEACRRGLAAVLADTAHTAPVTDAMVDAAARYTDAATALRAAFAAGRGGRQTV